MDFCYFHPELDAKLEITIVNRVLLFRLVVEDELLTAFTIRDFLPDTLFVGLLVLQNGTVYKYLRMSKDVRRKTFKVR